MNIKEIKKIMKKVSTNKKKTVVRTSDLLSTGSTMINLACAGTRFGGFRKGMYYFMVGDSSSGKTFLSLTCLAEAAINKNFNNYRFIYDNSENGALMNMETFFGKKMANRLEPPEKDKSGNPIYSTTIEEFYFHVDDAIKKKHPFIYVLDSMDSLSSESEKSKFNERKEAHRRGKETSGSYTDGKAKINSSDLRKLITPLRESGSILIVLNQTRANIGGSLYDRKTRSGGYALTFYACLELWSSVKEKIKKTIRGKTRQVGIVCRIHVKKNRVQGREPVVTIPIYYHSGFDDVGSCVNYLIEEGYWKKKAGKVLAKEFDYKGSEEGLVRYIEKKGYEKDLQMIVEDLWKDIENESIRKVPRKNKYTSPSSDDVVDRKKRKKYVTSKTIS